MDNARDRRQGVGVDALLLSLAAAAGAGALWWYQRPRRAPRALESAFDADAEVALHVADHEARARGQAIGSLHVLYGILQDETIGNAIRQTGHDPEGLEDRVLAALALADDSRDGSDDESFERAFHTAYAAGRRVTCRDLWAHVSPSAAAVIAAAEISHLAILFRLCHGGDPARRDDAFDGDVHVVLRNDDYSTREFVCEILERVFTFNAADAETRMMQAHSEGRAVVGRFAVSDARAKVRDVRALATSRGYPLWIGIEPI